ELCVARLAAVHAFTVLLEQFACPQALRRRLAQHRVLVGAQLGAPLLISFRDGVVHGASQSVEPVKRATLCTRALATGTASRGFLTRRACCRGAWCASPPASRAPRTIRVWQQFLTVIRGSRSGRRASSTSSAPRRRTAGRRSAPF